MVDLVVNMVVHFFDFSNGRFSGLGVPCVKYGCSVLNMVVHFFDF